MFFIMIFVYILFNCVFYLFLETQLLSTHESFHIFHFYPRQHNQRANFNWCAGFNFVRYLLKRVTKYNLRFQTFTNQRNDE